MKNIKLILIIILFIPFNILHSQFNIYYGIKTGMVLAHQNFELDEGSLTSSSDSRIGIDVGAFEESSFNKTLSLSCELHYLQKGEAYQERNYLISCISIPLLVKLKTQAGNFTPYLQLGPRWDIILNYDKSVYEYRKINRDNFGITFGIGSEYKLLKKLSLLADIRYDYDFTSYPYRSSDYLVDVRNMSLAFLVGVKF